MEKREKILAGGLGVVVLLYGALTFYDKQIVGPLNAKEELLVSTQEDSQKSIQEWKQLIRSQKLVRDSVNDSLPPDGQDAQRVYLKWVQELAELSGWKEVAPPSKSIDARGQLGKIGVRVPVTLTAKATLAQVARFLWHFDRTDLLQRVSSLKLTSPSTEGDPELTVVITVEGVSLAQAAPRKRLFPETEMTTAIDAQATQIVVADATGFPTEAPFRVRLGTEFATVTAMAGKTWTITRGVDETVAIDHPGATKVESAPIRSVPVGAESGLASSAKFIERSGFVKPAPLIEFTPRLATTTFPVMTRGEPWSAELRVEGWNPRWPAAVFELTSPPPGLTVTPSGKLEWKVPDDAKAGEFAFHVIAKAGDVTKVDVESKVTLRDMNHPPKFSTVGPLRAFVGRPVRLPVVATDEDEGSRLTYALSGPVPDGLTIDGSTGVISWTPPDTLDAAPVRIQVTATDNGTPPQSGTLEIRGQLDDDHAEYTFAVGFLDRDSDRMVLLNDRLTNVTTQVHVGDKYTSSEMELVVDAIDADGLIFRQGPNRIRVDIGQNLRSGKPLSPAPQIPPPPPASELLQHVSKPSDG